MRRETQRPRADWQQQCEKIGFAFHSQDGVYWDESAAFRFTAAEIDELEAATAELHERCLDAIDRVIERQWFDRFALAEGVAEYVTKSWQRKDAAVMGRFDVRFDGGSPPKLLEYNADTPTSLLEASVAQWQWQTEIRPRADQFNSLHEKLIARWQALGSELPVVPVVYFAAERESIEDTCNLEYLMDTAVQGGIEARYIAVEDIGWDEQRSRFVDTRNQPLNVLYKLYPWEWLTRESFAPQLLRSPLRVFEPPWKMLLSNKAILAVLWELFPGHPNLLPAYQEQGRIDGAFVKKPLLAREGANITIEDGARSLTSQDDGYGAEGYVYQAFEPLPDFGGGHVIIGSWMVGDEPAGIGIREDQTLITRNTSRFIPHYFE